MENIKKGCDWLINSRGFDFFITVVILINSFLIGVQTTYENEFVNEVQHIILYIFTFEVVVRMIGADNLKKFFKGGWNIFDFVLVVIGWIPPTLVSSASTMMALRVLRVFRVLRLLRTLEEIKIIVAVLIKSLRSLLYNGILFFIFMYLFAVAGVSMFRLPDPTNLSGEKLLMYEKLMEDAPHAPANSPDPFGTIGEAFFTLFRALTGEDWTDLRYNLITASEYNLITVSPSVITIYHILWFCIAAFLLLNLVTGAVINNYQISIAEEEEKRKLNKNKIFQNLNNEEAIEEILV